MACRLRAVGNKQNTPFTMFTPYCWNADCPAPGNSVDFLKMTLTLLNCTLEVVQIDASADETIDLIENGTADISLIALRQTRKRMQQVDFTSPVNFLYYGYLVKEVPQLKVEDYILASFEFDALGLMILAGLVVGVLVYFYTRLFNYHVGSMLYWMAACCQAFLRQFSVHLPGPIAAHVLVGFWLYFTILIVTNYEAKLKSFLTLSHARGTMFTDLDGLIDAVMHSGFSIVLQEGGYNPLLYCKPEQCRKLEEIPHDRIIRLRVEDDLIGTVNHPKRVGFMAYTNDINRYPICFVDVKRRVLFVRDSVAGPDFLAHAVAKNNSRLRESFNHAVTYTNPSYPNIRARYVNELAPYQESHSVRQEVTVLRFSHLSALFNTTAELIVLALIVLVLENLLFRYGLITGRFLRSLCPSFRHKLHINRSLAKDEFPRAHIVVLPPHRTASPPSAIFQKFSLSPSPSYYEGES